MRLSDTVAMWMKSLEMLRGHSLQSFWKNTRYLLFHVPLVAELESDSAAYMQKAQGLLLFKRGNIRNVVWCHLIQHRSSAQDWGLIASHFLTAGAKARPPMSKYVLYAFLTVGP